MFSPIESAVGGALIGLACSVALLVDGHIAGCSGVLGPWLRGIYLCEVQKKWWNGLFLLAMIGGGLVNQLFNKSFAFPGAVAMSPWFYAAGGILVGIGTRLAQGCTSGHGLCGLARFSPRSLVAVCTFMGVAALTVFLKRCKVGALQVAELQFPQTAFPYVALAAGIVAVIFLKFLPERALKVCGPLVSGALFGVGLGCSGMTDQKKVLGFLDFTDVWDPSLAFVMGCGLCVTVPTFAWARRGSARPLLLGAEFEAPGPGRGSKPVDAKLVVGSALFGCGWGLCGICPGPVLAAFIPNMLNSDDIAGFVYASTLVTIGVGWVLCDRLLTHSVTRTEVAQVVGCTQKEVLPS